jgi:leukotriene B4 12-hydroxydehydrogenase/15-oxo-prostaglandin 13-reductase
MATLNRRIALAARPSGYPKLSDFSLVQAPAPSPRDGEVLVRTLYLSVDPYMRSRMNDVRTYAKPFDLGEVMGGAAVARVVESSNSAFKTGDIVEGMFGWQDYAVTDGKGVRHIDPQLAPISTALGVLGMPGLTAYFGLLEICRPKPGETVVVSGAAGAVGSLVGQIAKLKGCRAVGIAGTDPKVAHLTADLGFAAAFNYKTTPDLHGRLKELCPLGVDVYFDNVGGAITDAVLRLINVGARISICGQISQYNLERPEPGPRPFSLLLVRRARAEGFLVFQFAERYAEGLREMALWLREGKIKYHETVVNGLENTPAAFIGMLKGENTGKQLVKVADA